MHIPGMICISPDCLPRSVYHIVLAFSATKKAREAMYFAEALARVSNAEITVVISGPDVRKRDSALAEATRFFAEKPLAVNYRNRDMAPGDMIIETADETGADLILMGGYSNSFVKRLFQSSTVEAVLSRTNIPVILCK